VRGPHHSPTLARLRGEPRASPSAKLGMGVPAVVPRAAGQTRRLAAHRARSKFLDTHRSCAAVHAGMMVFTSQKCKYCSWFYLWLAAFNLLLMLPLNNLVLIPNSYNGVLLKMLVIDSDDKFNTSASALNELHYDSCFFNLTNGYDLLNATLTPRPKPAFEEVCVRTNFRTQSFDFELNSDATEATVKQWSRIELVNVYDWNLELVTINPNLMALIGLFGSESVLAAVQPALYGALQYDTMNLKPDGTGALNDGIFVRHTLKELLRGYTTPITGQPDIIAAASDVYLGYESRADLEAAIEANTAVGLFGGPGDGGRHFTKTLKTGKGNPSEIGQLVAFKGHNNFSTVPLSDGLWLFADPGWDVAGNTSAGHATFSFDGLRVTDSQAPLAPSDYPWLAAAGMRPIGQLPTFGTSVTMLDDDMMRTFTFECENNCAGERIHDSIAIQKYTMADATWLLASGGVVDATGACLATAAGCDYGMREVAGFMAGGMMNTLPYFGDSPRRNLVSITPYGGGDELVYDAETMGKGKSVLFEPFTGLLLGSDSNLQQNTMISKALFDGALFSHVFGPTSAANPTFMWPMLRKHMVFELKRADAQDIAAIGPNILYLLMLIPCVLITVGGVLNLRESYNCWKKSRRLKISAGDLEAAQKAPPSA